MYKWIIARQHWNSNLNIYSIKSSRGKRRDLHERNEWEATCFLMIMQMLKLFNLFVYIATTARNGSCCVHSADGNKLPCIQWSGFWSLIVLWFQAFLILQQIAIGEINTKQEQVVKAL